MELATRYSSARRVNANAPLGHRGGVLVVVSPHSGLNRPQSSLESSLCWTTLLVGRLPAWRTPSHCSATIARPQTCLLQQTGSSQLVFPVAANPAVNATFPQKEAHMLR